MKKFLTNTILVLLIQSILMGQAFSSSRVDDVISEDRGQLLHELLVKFYDVQNQKSDLAGIEKHLKLTSKGQSIYLKFETIAGAMIVVGIVIGSYKARFPPGFRAMVGAYVTATGISRGLIKLTDKEVKTLLAEITKLNKVIKSTEDRLSDQIRNLCYEDESLPLCSH